MTAVDRKLHNAPQFKKLKELRDFLQSNSTKVVKIPSTGKYSKFFECLCIEVPTTMMTIQKIVYGSHKPSELLYRRIKSVLVDILGAEGKLGE